MKIYSFGSADKPTLLLLPGTFCHWRSNFGGVIPLLKNDFHVLCASYDGFDESESTEFVSMADELRKLEDYISRHHGGRLAAAYGCSLGGSFVGLLCAHGRVHIDRAILGSSDLDQASPLAARMQTALFVPLVYPLVRDGEFKSRLLRRRLEKRRVEMPEYADAFMRMFGGARPYVTERSCRNQFYSDLITPLPDGINPPGTQVHIFYALKMGTKYRERYLRHFAQPVIHEQDMLHEELLACHPEAWAALVRSVVLGV